MTGSRPCELFCIGVLRRLRKIIGAGLSVTVIGAAYVACASVLKSWAKQKTASAFARLREIGRASVA